MNIDVTYQKLEIATEYRATQLTPSETLELEQRGRNEKVEWRVVQQSPGRERSAAVTWRAGEDDLKYMNLSTII